MQSSAFPLALDTTEAGRSVPPGLPPVFDAHVHLMPDRLFQAIWGWFDRYAWPIRCKLPAREILPFFRQRGLQGVLALPYAHKPGIAGELNHWVAEAISMDPGSFGFATVYPGEPEAGDILGQAFALGLKGVKLHPHVQGIGPDAEEVQEICHICWTSGRALLLHAGREPKTPLFDYPVDPHAICSTGAIERILATFPGLRLCVPHLGADEFTAYRRLLERFDSLWLDTAMALSGVLPGVQPPDLQDYPAERIIYGSDFPTLPYPWDRELKLLASSNLPEEDLERILSLNAKEFLDL